jgi:sulfate adenylyltransferase
VTEAHAAGADASSPPASCAPGACIWLTGPSGAGKTTLTNALLPLLIAAGRTVTVLDTVPLLAKVPGERGSRGKLLRKAFVASEIVRHGGIAICVTVSTRRAVREEARAIVGADRFVEVHFDLPPELAAARRAQRGRKRSTLKRAKRTAARFAGRLSGRTHGYEAPLSPEVTIDAAACSAEDGAQLIFDALRARGYLSP